MRSPAVVALLAVSAGCAAGPERLPAPAEAPSATRLLPWPQEVAWLGGTRTLGPLRIHVAGDHVFLATARDTVRSCARPSSSPPVDLRIGAVDWGSAPEWLPAADREFLSAPGRSPEAYVLRVPAGGPIVIAGASPRGALYGAQTLNQLLLADPARARVPACAIRDWPESRWRCLSPSLTWYSGFNRLEGYDLNNWTLDEWKWLVDWSLLHKINAWAVCMYGYWPFTLDGYPGSELSLPSFRRDPATGLKAPWIFIHPNVRKEFWPEVCAYARARGIEMLAYIGKNSFNGGYFLRHPEARADGAVELLPFHPGVQDYWRAFTHRLLDMGFDGFVFEDPEANHVPNRNADCYRMFWEPWAKTYGYASVAQTDENKPPLGVHVEYYAWLFREFDGILRAWGAAHGRDVPVYLISHILLHRIMAESASDEERRRWFALVDAKQGRLVPFIINESDEAKYVAFFGPDRVASLGGRGGACTCAMRRIASVNNNTLGGPMGATVDYERDCQRRIVRAGGFGAMGYVFEWTNTEIFGYIAAQHLWRSAGVPGIDNDDPVGFLDYAYRLHYGDAAGALVARALDEGPCVNDAMVLEDVHGSQYPETGRALHRDYQLLAALADRAVGLAREAYHAYTGVEPDLERPAYEPQSFRWSAGDPEADRLFKTERLRHLYVSARRSQAMCEAALAHRLAQRRLAEGASTGAVLDALDRAVSAARENERIYQINYEDDYDWTDGLCSRVTERLEMERRQFLVASLGAGKPLRTWEFRKPGNALGWTTVHDLAAVEVADGFFSARASGDDPFMVQAQPLDIPVTPDCFVEVEMASDRSGMGQVFYGTDGAPFAEERSERFEMSAGPEPSVYRVTPKWQGRLTGLRVDFPPRSNVRVTAIRLAELPPGDLAAGLDRDRPPPPPARRLAVKPLFVPWEKQTDVVPARPAATEEGLYLSVDLGLHPAPDYYRLGVVFTVQLAGDDGGWRTVFRRAVTRRSRGRRSRGWEHWDIPLGAKAGMGGRPLRVRLVTDSYSRAQDRAWPTWRWAVWGAPRLVRIGADGGRRVLYDFVERLGECRALVRLDSDGRERPFDPAGEDSTGATFRRAEAAEVPAPQRPAIAAYAPHRNGAAGVTIGEYEVRVPDTATDTPIRRRPQDGFRGTDALPYRTSQGGQVADGRLKLPEKLTTYLEKPAHSVTVPTSAADSLSRKHMAATFSTDNRVPVLRLYKAF